jgi:hypothetical protein
MAKEQTFSQLEIGVAKEYILLKNFLPDHYLLSMAEIEVTKEGELFIRNFTSFFDARYAGGTARQKYESYISDMRNTRLSYREPISWDPMDGSNSP